MMHNEPWLRHGCLFEPDTIGRLLRRQLREFHAYRIPQTLYGSGRW